MAPLRRFVSRFRVDRGPLRWWLIVAGILLIRYSAGRFALGIAFVVSGAVLHLLSKCYLRQSKSFLRRTGALTTRGPYRFTRNPFYLANLLAEIGLLVIIGRFEVAILYLMVWGWVYRHTIKTEEATLLQLCGETYARYCTRVPRLIPVPWKYLAGRDATGPCFTWRNPNIVGGKELERSLRLLTYPLLFRVAAAFHEVPDWSLSGLSLSTLLSGAGFVVLNAVGWCSTRLMNRLRESTDKTSSPSEASQTDASGPRCNLSRWVAVLLVGLLTGLGWGVSNYRYYLWPKRFRVVEEGQIYRGGWQTPVVLQRILRDYRIKTLLNVACTPSEPEAAGEGPVVREAGVDWFKILMPGTGLATLPQLDEAADILAEPANRPIFIHCAAGVHRTNMALAAYRLKYCGWSLDAALDEMANNGYDRTNDKAKPILLGEYLDHLHASPAPIRRSSGG